MSLFHLSFLEDIFCQLENAILELFLVLEFPLDLKKKDSGSQVKFFISMYFFNTYLHCFETFVR